MDTLTRQLIRAFSGWDTPRIYDFYSLVFKIWPDKLNWYHPRQYSFGSHFQAYFPRPQQDPFGPPIASHRPWTLITIMTLYLCHWTRKKSGPEVIPQFIHRHVFHFELTGMIPQSPVSTLFRKGFSSGVFLAYWWKCGMMKQFKRCSL